MIVSGGTLALMNWLQTKSLLKSNMRCPERNCRAEMKLTMKTNIQDGYEWRCPRRRCAKRRSLRTGSIFANSNLLLREITMIIYFWSNRVRASIVSEMLDCSKPTVTNWYNKLREMCPADCRVDNRQAFETVIQHIAEQY